MSSQSNPSAICPLCVIDVGGKPEPILPGVTVGYCYDRHQYSADKMSEWDKWADLVNPGVIVDAYYNDPAGAEAAIARERERIKAKNPHRMFLVNYLLACPLAADNPPSGD